MKRKILSVVSVFLSLVFMLSVSTESLAARSHGWYIKRNGHERPGFPEDASLLEDYNCYYLGREDGSKKIYLTFDAGYENGNVSRILDTLRDENVPAAFFLLDNIILKNKDLVKRMSDEGHLVCNHTLRHRDLSKSDYDEIFKDLRALEEIYFNATGRVMSKYFRFPEGKYSLDAVKHIDRMGYKIIFWSFAYEDWNNEKQPAADKAIKKIIDNTHDGAVMLFHPTSSTNADIFSELIKAWREMGYTFGTLDELTR